MQLLRADADFGAKAEFKAIGKACRRVDVDSGRIDGGLEGGSCGLVFRDDGFRMMGAETADMSSASWREPTTLTDMMRALYSVAQSSSLAASWRWTGGLRRHRAARRRRLS